MSVIQYGELDEKECNKTFNELTGSQYSTIQRKKIEVSWILAVIIWRISYKNGKQT